MNVGIDLLGSDRDPKSLLQAAWDQTKKTPFKLHAFGPPMEGYPGVIWHPCHEEVSMKAAGIRSAQNQNTSMSQGILALKKGEIDAFISCGNTGALLTYSHLILEKLPGIHRQALVARIGTEQGFCYVMDVGANIQTSAFQLCQFALMGRAFCRSLLDEEPTFGLLNMASEEGKGPSNVKEAYQHLKGYPNFLGNIEPEMLFKGQCRLVITDGFSGNILLKTAEAVAQMTLKDQLSHSPYDPSIYPGAVLCGADKLVMKCHGTGHTRALQETIQEALRLHSRQFTTRVNQEISALKEESF